MPNEDKPVKKFRVRMLKGYFPIDPDHPRNPLTDTAPQRQESMKVLRGTEIDLPIEEARRCIKLGIAERADELPVA